MNFSSQGKQLCIDDFKSSLEGLNKSNRWVQLGDTLPWSEIEKLYNIIGLHCPLGNEAFVVRWSASLLPLFLSMGIPFTLVFLPFYFLPLH